MTPEPNPPSTLTEHERAQLAHILAHTTAADRILMVEEMRLMFGLEHLRQARERKWQMDRNPDGSEKIPVNWGDRQLSLTAP